jgi:hypothetical protein
MRTTKLGDLTVSAQGLGCMGMSEWYGVTDWCPDVRPRPPHRPGRAGPPDHPGRAAGPADRPVEQPDHQMTTR